MEKFLKSIGVLQERKGRRGYKFKQQRFNPYNPLTYLLIVVTAVLSLILYGIVGMWSKMGSPKRWFKWV